MGQKIFGIGFQKTGTSSLNRAVAILGYRAAGGIRFNHPKGVTIEPPLSREKILPIALRSAETADAFSDNPWPLLFRELDGAFPGAKFILTVREPEEWIASLIRHFGDRPNDTMTWIYGVPYPQGNESRCLAVYNAHNEAVRSYFAARPDDLLELNLTTGADWAALCKFLRQPVPAAPFPHDNTAERRERRGRALWTQMKTSIRTAFAS